MGGPMSAHSSYWVPDWRHDPWTEPTGLGRRCDACGKRKASVRRDPGDRLKRDLCNRCWFASRPAGPGDVEPGRWAG